MRPLPLIAASALVLVLLVAPVFATSYTITVTTDMAAYSGTEAVHVSGTVSPSPGASQAVSFTVTNPGGTTYPLAGTANIDPTTGDFTFVFNTGGPYYTASGSYTLTAEYSGFYGSTHFSYTPAVTVTTGISMQQYNNLMGNLTMLKGEITSLQQQQATLSKDLAGNSSSLSSAISSLSSSVGSVSSAVTSLTSSVASITSAVGTLTTNLGTVSTQVTTAATDATNAANAVSTTQTYVLVVAVIVAITLVLELAILVRKVS
jgi:hypothetical protein